MPRVLAIRDLAVIPCSLRNETRNAIRDFAAALKTAAPSVGTHGLDDKRFWDSGLFHGAIERLRGQRAASMGPKREFLAEILNLLKDAGRIKNWVIAGGSDRHDYEVVLPDDTVTAIEAKGCLDGNNTNIFQRPANADEFIIWSLCQNSGADPRHNAWSGIHTRLSAEIMHKRQQVDGLVIWDMVCGTLGRICPKLERSPERATAVGRRSLPPPCIYLFPRTVPDARNNPKPRCWRLADVKFLKMLHETFKGDAEDVTEVRIEACMQGASVLRTTRLVRDGVEIIASQPTRLKRAT
jgi:hypothetical protein